MNPVHSKEPVRRTVATAGLMMASLVNKYYVAQYPLIIVYIRCPTYRYYLFLTYFLYFVTVARYFTVAYEHEYIVFSPCFQFNKGEEDSRYRLRVCPSAYP